MHADGEPHAGVRVTIELEGSAGPITGSLAVGDGDPSPFAGWIELASRLERARCASRPRSAGERDTGPPCNAIGTFACPE